MIIHIITNLGNFCIYGFRGTFGHKKMFMFCLSRRKLIDTRLKFAIP